MNPVIALATARRVLAQLRHDRRTLAMALVVPTLLMVLLRFVFDEEAAFDAVAPALLGLLPFLVMFLITSVSTLRERTSGTLERLLTLPTAKLDLLLGYALAFSLVCLVQVALAVAVSLSWLGLDITGPLWMLFLVAALDALLGTALGLLVSAFARTEFQAVQFMPAVVLPQVLLCGLFTPRDQMASFLDYLSDVLPLSYAVDAMTELSRHTGIGADLVAQVSVISAALLLSLVLGAATLRRQTA
ncbi:ABC transporter permease [Streptomyces sp. NPDC050803]|uniref:ABC transporter permease n=1 Tax=unclassified Streptomyces TaxID=2593676 RepID=UPI00341F25BE